MMLLKQVAITAIYSHVQKGAEGALTPGRVYGKVWDVCTPVGVDFDLPKSKLFKSITAEISDDIRKKKNFLDLVSGVFEASNSHNFREYYNVSNATQFKEAHSFEFCGKKIKIHEVKNTRKKERLYIYCGEIGKKRCVLLLAIHKKDETTPDGVKNYCEEKIKELLKSQQGKS